MVPGEQPQSPVSIEPPQALLHPLLDARAWDGSRGRCEQRFFSALGMVNLGFRCMGNDSPFSALPVGEVRAAAPALGALALVLGGSAGAGLAVESWESDLV